jgi:hypothetical protein
MEIGNSGTGAAIQQNRQRIRRFDSAKNPSFASREGRVSFVPERVENENFVREKQVVITAKAAWAAS